jgi:hypothetical protein
MSSEPDISAAAESCAAKDTVILTRELWNWYFVVAMAVASIAALCLLLAGGGWPALKPFGLVVFWLAWRFQTPKSGISAHRVSATPGGMHYLALSAFVVTLAAGLVAYDALWIGCGWNEPLEFYQVVRYLALLALLLVGVRIIEKRYLVKR